MNKTLKSIVSVFLIAVMIFSFAACGKGNSSEEKKTLTMATECTFPPYEFYDGDQIVGIDVEIAKAVCEKMGYNFEVVDIAFDSIIPGVQSGKYDFGLAGMTVTEDRLEEVAFSSSYATGIQVVIVPENGKVTSVDDLFAEGAWTVIGTQSGTTGNLYATWDIADEGLGEVLGYQKTTDAIQALLTGKCDCIILDSEPAKALVAQNAGLKILDTEYAVEDYAACFAKDNTELCYKFDEALKVLLADGTVRKIIEKYIN